MGHDPASRSLSLLRSRGNAAARHPSQVKLQGPTDAKEHPHPKAVEVSGSFVMVLKEA